MAEVIIEFKIMPDSVETDMDKLKEKATEIISKAGEVGKTEIEEIAFGLKALHVFAVMDESKGSPDEIEQQLNDLDEVNSAEVVDVRRTVDV